MERALTQEWVALEAEITPAYLGLIEREKRNPTVAVVEKICAVMNVSLSEFFAAAASPAEVKDNATQQIILLFSTLSESEKQDFLNIAKSIIQFRKTDVHEVSVRNAVFEDTAP